MRYGWTADKYGVTWQIIQSQGEFKQKIMPSLLFVGDQCGWLKDQYGVSWQIVPKELYTLLRDEDEVRGKRVTEALMQMKRISLPKLREVYQEGGSLQ